MHVPNSLITEEDTNAYDTKMAQAIHDSEHKNVMPIVAHRKNNAKWLITMMADDWFEMYKESGLSNGS